MCDAFRRVDWTLPTDVDYTVSFLTNQILMVTKQFVPYCRPRLVRPVPWWNRDCQWVWGAKLSAWRCGDSGRYKFFADWPGAPITLLFNVISSVLGRLCSLGGQSLVFGGVSLETLLALILTVRGLFPLLMIWLATLCRNLSSLMRLPIPFLLCLLIVLLLLCPLFV